MSCVVAAVQVPRLAGARSCCPSKADSVLHWADTGCRTLHPPLEQTLCFGSMVNLTSSSPLSGIFQRRGPACVQLGPSPLPSPSCIPVLWGEGETRIWINGFALTSHRSSTLFSPMGQTRLLPPAACASKVTELCPGKDTSKEREQGFLQDGHQNHLFLSFLTLRVGRTSEHCRHKTTSFVGHISV